MRGMKKWLPFKSLKDQYRVLNGVVNERNKQEKPELSSDQIEELNRALVTLQKGEATKVTYFEDGSIISREARFLKSDGYLQTVFFKGFSLPFAALLKLEY